MNNYPTRQEIPYYDAAKEFYVTRSMDVAAYLELKLGEEAKAEVFKNSFGDKVQFSFINSPSIRDLLEIYDRGEASVEPRSYSEIKMKLITIRRELLPKKVQA